jgi:hypothetical protein
MSRDNMKAAALRLARLVLPYNCRAPRAVRYGKRSRAQAGANKRRFAHLSPDRLGTGYDLQQRPGPTATSPMRAGRARRERTPLAITGMLIFRD